MPSFDLTAILKARDASMASTLSASGKNIMSVGDKLSRLSTQLQVTSGFFGGLLGFSMVNSMRSFTLESIDATRNFENWRGTIGSMLKATGADFEAQVPKINDSLVGMSRTSRFSLDELRGAFSNILSVIVSAKGDPNDALQILKISMDAAAARGENLSSTARDLAKAWGTDAVTELKKFGVDIETSVITPIGSLSEALRLAVDNTSASMLATDDLIERLKKLGVEADAGEDKLLSQKEGLLGLLEAYQGGKIPLSDFQKALEDLGIPMERIEIRMISGKDAVLQLGQAHKDVSNTGIAAWQQWDTQTQLWKEGLGYSINDAVGLYQHLYNTIMSTVPKSTDEIKRSSAVTTQSYTDTGEQVEIVSDHFKSSTGLITAANSDMVQNIARQMMDFGSQYNTVLSRVEQETGLKMGSVVDMFTSSFNNILRAAQSLWDQLTIHSVWPDMLNDMQTQTNSALPAVEGRFQQLSTNITNSVTTIPAGSHTSSGSVVNLNFYGPTYGIDEFDLKVHSAINRALGSGGILLR